MGDAIGLDLGAATAAAARFRGDEIGPTAVVPTADLGVGATTTTTTCHQLESLAARVVGPDNLPAVGVAIPTLNPVDQDEVDAAAREAFGHPLLVLRPVAAAAWFLHSNEVHQDAVLVVVEADETEMAVTLVRPWPRIPSIERQPVGWLLSSGAPAEDAVDIVGATLNAAGLDRTDIDVAVIIGGATWLAGLADGITAARGLAAVVAAEPLAAVACGAALLAAESDGLGLGTALALGAPAVGAGLAATAAPAAGPALGSGLGEAVGATGGAGTGLSAALRNMGEGKDAPTEPVGGDLGDAVGGYKEPPSSPGADGGEGDGSAKRPPSRLPAGGLKRRLVLVAPAVVAVLAVGGLTVRSCTQDPDTSTMATASEPADPDDPSTTGTDGTDGVSPGGSDKPDPLDPTSSERSTSTSTTRPTTTTRRTAPTTLTPGTPPPPGTPVAPPANPPPRQDTTAPSIANLASSETDFYADNLECDLQMSTLLSATITDDTGVAEATISWSATGGPSGVLTMARAQGNTWSATLGPLRNDTLTTDDNLPVSWSVVAVDAAGNKTDSDSAGGVTFHGCRIVIG
jgi:hypothetical protein